MIFLQNKTNRRMEIHVPGSTVQVYSTQLVNGVAKKRRQRMRATSALHILPSGEVSTMPDGRPITDDDLNIPAIQARIKRQELFVRRSSR